MYIEVINSINIQYSFTYIHDSCLVVYKEKKMKVLLVNFFIWLNDK